MTEEEIHQLKQEKEIAELKAACVLKDQRIEELEGLLMRALLRIDELERRLSKDSHNSHKPPSSDGLKHKVKPRSKKQRSSGGQPGHQGHALQAVEQPDEVITHRPQHCEACHQALGECAGHVRERRQIHELPELRLQVIEHRVEAIDCPMCQHVTTASFPSGVDAPVQYGPRMRALAVYLSHFQLLPMERIQELCGDLLGCHLSEGSLSNWSQQAARTLEPTMLRLKELLKWSHLTHVDETGARIKGLLHWFHVQGNRWLTFYGWHRKRGQQAINQMGLIPGYTGRLMHDRWKSYESYACQHSLCGAHLLRDCLRVVEHEKQPWAQAMYELLLRMGQVAEQWRTSGAKAVPNVQRDELVAEYFEVLRQGYATHHSSLPSSTAPPRQMSSLPKKPGPVKQTEAKNLLDALLKRAEQVLAFLDDLALPFTNNLAERDLRMIKVQQKISGTFRSEKGATAFCAIRSYLSTMRKQGRSMLAAMTAVFEGSPFPLAWEPGT
jgi:transposase